MLAAAKIAELRSAGRVRATVPTRARLVRASTFQALKFPEVFPHTSPPPWLLHLQSDQRKISARPMHAVATATVGWIHQSLPTTTDQFQAPRVRRLPSLSCRSRAA